MAGMFAQAFKGQRKKLINMIDVNNIFLDDLQDAAIISLHMKECILAEHRPYDRGSQLFNYLERSCPDKYFEPFCDILATMREDAVDMMRANLQQLSDRGIAPQKNTTNPSPAASAKKRTDGSACDTFIGSEAVAPSPATINKQIDGSSRDSFDGEKWSNDILKAAFKELHSTIIRELDVHDVIDDLFSKDIVDTNIVQEMNSKVNDATTVRKLLTHLHSLNNVNTFKILRQALWSDTNKSKYSLLLSEIEKCCSELEKSQQVTAVKSTIPHGDVYVSSTENVTKQAQQLEPAKGTMNRARPLKEQTPAAQLAVAHVIAPREDRKGDVFGLTVHGDELFIVRREPKGLIEVYSANTFTFKQNIKVKELERSWLCGGLTACNSNNCLYVSYLRLGDGWYIARVELTGDNNVLEWKVKEDYYYSPVGLSVNSEHNLIVACGVLRSNRLIEYTTRGELVREILLQDDIKDLWHAIQLNSCQYLVSYGLYDDSRHRVCVVDANGRVLLSYGNKGGAESEQWNFPIHLAVDRNGFIFVADCSNNRIVVLDSKLKWSRDLLIDGGSLVKKPRSLYLDEKRNLLFVCENSGDASRVVIVTV